MHSVSSEQAFLETYFLVLSQFGFDKAKELAVSLIISKVLARFQNRANHPGHVTDVSEFGHQGRIFIFFTGEVEKF